MSKTLSIVLPLYNAEKLLPRVLPPLTGAVERGEAAGIVREAGAGLVIPPENPEALAEAAVALFNDEALRSRLGTASAAAAASYSRSAQADRMLDVLKGVARTIPIEDGESASQQS